MERNKEKKIVGSISLDEALERFASKSEENRDVVALSLKLRSLMEQIIDERQFLGMTQRDLANITGIKQPMIARIERLESVPRLDTFIKIANQLELDVILSFKDNYSPMNVGMRPLKYKSTNSYNNSIYKTKYTYVEA